MENKPRFTKTELESSRRNFLKVASYAVASAAGIYASVLTQSTFESEDNTHHTPNPTTNPTINPVVIDEPRVNEKETQQVVTENEPYKYGDLDLSKTGFTLLPSRELQKNLRHFVPAHERTAKIPLPLIEPGRGTDEQREIFIKSGTNHSEGNPYFIIIAESNDPNIPLNHYFVIFHSRQLTSPGDLSREIAGFIHKYPDKSNLIIGQKIALTFDGFDTSEAEIVYANNVKTEYFDSNEPWNFNEKFMLITASQERFDIPEEIQNDRSPDTMYLTIIGCQNINPGEITDYDLPGAEAANDAMRSLLTIKFKIPSK